MGEAAEVLADIKEGLETLAKVSKRDLIRSKRDLLSKGGAAEVLADIKEGFETLAKVSKRDLLMSKRDLPR